MKTLVRFIVASCVATLFPVVALAQEPQIPPPQLPSVIDQNGVRLNTGKIGLGHSYGKVGAGQGGLGLSASKWIGGQDPDEGWRENIDNTIEADGTLLIVSVGGSYDAFGWNISSDTLTASVGSVATLQFIDGGSLGRKFAYTSPDGSIFTFPTDVTAYELDNLHPDNGRQLLASLSEVIHPDGEIDTYSLYAASPERPQIITNNLGYMQRGYDGWAPINLGSIYCAATTTSCAEFSAAQWPGYANPAPSFQVNGEHLQEFHAASGFGQDEYVDVYRNISSTITYPNGDQIIAHYDPAAPYTTPNGSILVPREDGIKSVSRFGSTWLYSGYTDNTSQFVKTVTSPSGVVERYEFDHQGGGKLIKYEVLPAGGGTILTTIVEYDAVNLPYRITYPEGDKVQYIYNLGRVTEIRKIAKPGATEPNMVTSYTYEACDATNRKYCAKPKTSTDELGSVTKYKYASEHGGVTEVQLPFVTGVGYTKTKIEYAQFYAWYRTSSSATKVQDLRPVWRKTKEITCVVATEAATCADGSSSARVTEYIYEQGSASNASNVRLLQVRRRSGDSALSQIVSSTYDARGRTTSDDRPLSGTTDMVWFEYDSRDNQTRKTNADPDGTGPRRYTYIKTSYNSSNQVEFEETGWSTSNASGSTDTRLGATDYVYDAYGREKWRITLDQNLAAVSLVQTSYDNAGRVDCVALRLTAATYGSLPTSACTQTASADDRITKTSYDPYGRAYKIMDGVGTTLQRTAKESAFTPNGQLLTIKDGKGNQTTYQYDGLDRLIKTSFPNVSGSGSSLTDYELLTYRLQNSLSTPLVQTKRLRDGQSIAYTNDPLGRQILQDAPGTAHDLTTTYNGFGETLTLAANGQTLTRAWDGLGRMTSEQGPLGSVSYGYDSGGRLATLTYPGAFNVTYQYDGADAPTTVKENGSTTLVTYTYDPFGRLTTITRGNGTYSSYGYDTASRLKDLDYYLPAAGAYNQQVDYTRNAASQIITKTVSNASYLPTTTTVTTGYGINGLNQVTSIGATPAQHDLRGNMRDDGSRQYTYDPLNRMQTVVGTATFGYDPADRLYQTAGSATTRFLYAGEKLLAEYDTSGTVLRRYVHAPGVDVPIVWYEGSAISSTTRRYLTTDERGSVVLVTSNAGAVIAQNKYDEYGVPEASNVGRFQYTGQTWVSEAALYYYKARMYNPGLGRFMQTDPIGYEDNPNLYAYVGNDPMNQVDPSGTVTNVLFSSEIREGGRLDSQHTAVMVDQSGIDDNGDKEPIGGHALYDPNGSQEMLGPNGPGNLAAVDGSGHNLQVGPGATVGDYVAAQFATYKNIDAVVVVAIPTSAADEAQIIANAQEQGGGGALDCTCKSSSAISGVGPIPDIGQVWLPNDLRSSLQGSFPSTTYYRDGSSADYSPPVHKPRLSIRDLNNGNIR